MALELVKNYRGITVTSIEAKIYNALLRNRIEPKIDNILRKNQNGFRRNRSTTSQILTIRRIFEGVRAKNLSILLTHLTPTWTDLFLVHHVLMPLSKTCTPFNYLLKFGLSGREVLIRWMWFCNLFRKRKKNMYSIQEMSSFGEYLVKWRIIRLFSTYPKCVSGSTRFYNNMNPLYRQTIIRITLLIEPSCIKIYVEVYLMCVCVCLCVWERERQREREKERESVCVCVCGWNRKR